MKNENEKLDQMFENFNNQWDTQNLGNNHEERFFNKLNSTKPTKKYLIPLLIAASILLLLGLSLFNNTQKIDSNELKFASKETKQTDSIFTVLIENQLEKINEKKSPENNKIISDALKQMKILDNDYAKIIQELEINGESKQIIKALISNLQTRISFLQDVLQHIEENEKINTIPNEKKI